ncbi:MAG TPA: trypsin-like serine protease, partial [Solirubrobacterales bacterium]
MNCATGPRARLLSGALLALALLASDIARAGAPPVHALGGGPAASKAADVRVPGRAPLRRFLHPPVASASSDRVASAAEVGHRTNGKIVGIDPKKGNFSCSGTALNTPSRSIVLTAGHCVIANGRIAKRLAFVPAYDHGRRPFGTFPVRAYYVTPQWRESENPDFDVAALRVAPNGFGALTDVVGARGFATSRSRTAKFQIYGYPAAALR